MIHTLQARVYYEDTDAGGIVYHANYLKFAERGRTEYLREAGFDHKTLGEQDGILFVVRHMEIDWLAPAKLDDLLTVETVVAQLKRTSFVMHQKIIRGDAPICEISVIVVAVGRDGKPAGMPPHMRAEFEKLVVMEQA